MLIYKLVSDPGQGKGSGQDPPDVKEDPVFSHSSVEGSGVGGAAGPSVLQKHSCPPVFFLSIELGLF